MRSMWSCSSCIVLLWSAMLGSMVKAEPEPMPTPTFVAKWFPQPQKLAKAQITPFPIPYKRDGEMCQASYSLCAASVGGGCCQEGYACSTDSCYLTEPPVATACGKTGLVQCPLSLNGGCCPVGYVCGRGRECTAPAGLSNLVTSCPNTLKLCAASYNYGCCPSSMACGVNACYSTNPATYTVSSIVVTTSDGHTITTVQTAVTVMIPTVPAGLPTDDSNYAAKFIPTTVPKVSPTSAASAGGLTSAQIGGIVGGAVALLLIVLTAAFLIIRHLNLVMNAVESSKDASSATHTKSQVQMAYNGHKQHPSPSEVDAMSYDPLMMSNRSAGSTPQAAGHAGARYRSDSGSQASTPYNPSSSATAEIAAIRHQSVESQGYFDIPTRVQNVPGRHPGSVGGRPGQRVSTDSQGTQFTTTYPGYAYQQHGRHGSNISDAASSDGGGGIGSPLIPAELDPGAGVMSELPSNNGNGTRSRSSSITATPLSATQPRRRSDPPRSATSAPNDGGFGLGFVGMQQQQPLDPVNEGAEVIHGYYGPRDQAVGQTAAGLDISQDVSSPVNGRTPQQWMGPAQFGPQDGHHQMG